METNPHISALFRKYLDGNIGKQELEELLAHFDIEENEADIRFLIHNELMNLEEANSNKDMDKLLIDVKLKLRNRIQPQVKRHVNWIQIAIAASFLIAIASIIYLSAPEPSHKQQRIQVNNDIEPGGNKAILTLSNGREIDLNEKSDLKLAEDNGVRIQKNEDGVIAYLPGKEHHTGSAATAYNTIRTPKGGQYHIILPDGSKVWLNAATTLKYPVGFGTEARTVEITGEAYFDIIPQKDHPFIVKSADQEVKVLGTRFNINAYPDEPFTSTTLEQGAVLVFNRADKQSAKIKPGQQVISRGGRFEKRNIIVEDQMAWKDDLIVLNNADLPSIMRQIERWYDVSFETNVELPKGTFSGELPRNIKLSELLKALRVNTGINFKVEGRRILPVK